MTSTSFLRIEMAFSCLDFSRNVESTKDSPLDAEFIADEENVGILGTRDLERGQSEFGIISTSS